MSPPKLDRSYLEQVHAEHEELRRLISKVRKAIADETSEKRELASHVGELVDLCESHFGAEESNGYLRDASKTAPQLANRIEAMLSQHESLLEDLETLRVLVQSGVDSAAWRRRVEDDFAALAQRLFDHEAGEMALVQEAFAEQNGS
ncbi:MAG: hemerythrin domain-containing protein [Planctomycetales bacterium]|nr:hemerythrin domain-containing protein [Planctomycetales bacterium]